MRSWAYADVEDLARLGQDFDDECRFFIALNDLKGKRFTVQAVGNTDCACDLIDKAGV